MENINEEVLQVRSEAQGAYFGDMEFAPLSYLPEELGWFKALVYLSEVLRLCMDSGTVGHRA